MRRGRKRYVDRQRVHPAVGGRPRLVRQVRAADREQLVRRRVAGSTSSSAAVTARRCLRRRAHDDLLADLLPGERRREPVVGLHRGYRLGQVLLRRLALLHVQRGQREGEHGQGGDQEGRAGTPQRGLEQGRPQPGLAGAVREPPQDRHARTVDAPAELGQHSRQDGQRAEHRDGDDQDRTGGQRGERRRRGSGTCPPSTTITARPETITECPDVCAAISMASMWLRPRARSSRSRLR